MLIVLWKNIWRFIFLFHVPQWHTKACKSIIRTDFMCPNHDTTEACKSIIRTNFVYPNHDTIISTPVKSFSVPTSRAITLAPSKPPTEFWNVPSPWFHQSLQQSSETCHHLGSIKASNRVLKLDFMYPHHDTVKACKRVPSPEFQTINACKSSLSTSISETAKDSPNCTHKTATNGWSTDHKPYTPEINNQARPDRQIDWLINWLL